MRPPPSGSRRKPRVSEVEERESRKGRHSSYETDSEGTCFQGPGRHANAAALRPHSLIR